MQEHKAQQDIRKAWTLPSSFYTSPQIFEEQKEKVFASSWQFIGDVASVRVPGQVFPFTLLEGCLDEPLLLTRDMDDRLHCISNVCTHRGNLVCEAAGHERHLRCRYHGRRFSLDGKFQQMPEFEDAEAFPSETDNLPKAPFGNWKQFLFASIHPCCSLEELLHPMQERVAWMPFERAVFDSSRARDYLVRANWALYCDNYLEGFHIPFVHADLNAALDYGNYSTELYEYSNLQLAVAKPGEDCFELPEGALDYGNEIAAYYFWIYPNTMFNFYPWGVSINVVRPLAVDLTKVSFYPYVWDESRIGVGAGALLDRVEREDESVVECVQRGVRSRLYERGRYSPSREQCVHHFHRLLNSTIK